MKYIRTIISVATFGCASSCGPIHSDSEHSEPQRLSATAPQWMSSPLGSEQNPFGFVFNYGQCIVGPGEGYRDQFLPFVKENTPNELYDSEHNWDYPPNILYRPLESIFSEIEFVVRNQPEKSQYQTNDEYYEIISNHYSSINENYDDFWIVLPGYSNNAYSLWGIDNNFRYNAEEESFSYNLVGMRYVDAGQMRDIVFQTRMINTDRYRYGRQNRVINIDINRELAQETHRNLRAVVRASIRSPYIDRSEYTRNQLDYRIRDVIVEMHEVKFIDICSGQVFSRINL